MTTHFATFTDAGFDPRTHVVFAIERLKEKAPQSISFDDLVSYVLPVPKRENSAQVERFKDFLRVNPKVSYDSKSDSFRFKPTLAIYTASDLLTYLQKQDTALGVSVRDLKDGWPNVEETIDHLEKEHRLLVTRQKKDKAPRMVWANDPSLFAPLDPEFQEMWGKISLPPAEEVIRALEREKLNPAGQVALPKAGPVKEKKIKKVRRGAKITNIHIQDQFRDYSQQRPQAGK